MRTPQSRSRVIGRGRMSSTQPEREVADVRAPARARLDPTSKRICERRQVEEEVVRLAEHRRRPVDLRARIDQLGRVELVAAVVALVAACLRVTADRARSLDVAVRERVAGGRRERDELGLFDDRSMLVERLEEVLRDPRVVRRRRAGEAVVGEPEPAEVLAVRPVVEVGDLTRSDFPSASAATITGVPCSSVPLTASTSFPFSR